jgi:phosphoglycerate dehydrogenase-like enzyme
MVQRLPALRVICAMGAGVDYLFGSGIEPPNAPVTLTRGRRGA